MDQYFILSFASVNLLERNVHIFSRIPNLVYDLSFLLIYLFENIIPYQKDSLI